jgi:hypothetical protein
MWLCRDRLTEEPDPGSPWHAAGPRSCAVALPARKRNLCPAKIMANMPPNANTDRYEWRTALRAHTAT